LNKPEAFTITLQTSNVQWRCASNETLLQSAERQGLALPSSCRNGTCRTCLVHTQSTEHAYSLAWPGLSLEEKRQGDTLCCVALPKEDVCIEDQHFSPEVYAQAFHLVAQDPSFLVLNKPSGLLSVPGRGPLKSDCLSSRVQHKFPTALIVHRLDQATSGLLLMALGPEAQKGLNQMFSTGQVHKRYMAKVQGALPVSSSWQLIDAPIYADWPLRPLRVVDAKGKASQTRYRCLQSDNKHSLLEIEPLSGRTHQIRVHLSHIGHPILGDQLYAPEDVANESTRLLLHAQSLRFVHPLTLEPFELDSPCPLDFYPNDSQSGPAPK